MEENLYLYYEKLDSSSTKPVYRILHLPVKLKIQDCLTGSAVASNPSMHSNQQTSNIDIRKPVVNYIIFWKKNVEIIYTVRNSTFII